MKAIFEIDLEKYNDKKTENDYLDIDRLGEIWLCHEEHGWKHWELASDKELRDWGIEKFDGYGKDTTDKKTETKTETDPQNDVWMCID